MADTQTSTNGLSSTQSQFQSQSQSQSQPLSQSQGASQATAKASSPSTQNVNTQQTANGTSTSTPPPSQQAAPLTDSKAQHYITQSTGPNISLRDDGVATRPRDARTIHMVLAALGVTAYQERVPLQLLDFAYRYTSSVLSDAQHLASEGYITAEETARSKSKTATSAAAAAEGGISLAAVRLATSSRLGYQFNPALPKETMLQVASERNRIKLPDVSKDTVFGVRLPHERFVLTGTSWNMREEWDSEEEEEVMEEAGVAEKEESDAAAVPSLTTHGTSNGIMNGTAHADGPNETLDQEMGDDNDDEDDDQEGFEHVFGRDPAGQEDEEGDEDKMET